MANFHDKLLGAIEEARKGRRQGLRNEGLAGEAPPANQDLVQEVPGGNEEAPLAANPEQVEQVPRANNNVEAPLPEGNVVIEVPDYFLCPITRELMEEPVITRNGVTYSKASLLAWLQVNPSEPSSREPCRIEDTVPNIVIRDAVAAWKESTGYKGPDEREGI